MLGRMNQSRLKHIYEVRPRRDHRGVDLISDALPSGGLSLRSVLRLFPLASAGDAPTVPAAKRVQTRRLYLCCDIFLLS